MLSFWFEFIYTTYGTVVPLEERKMITWNCFYFYFVWIYENFKGTIESLSSLIRLTNRNILHTWHHMQGCQSIFFFFNVLDFSNIVYGCTDIHTYIRYSLIDLQLLFLLPFQLSAWVVYLYRCVFFIFWFNVCPHFVRFVFKLLFCFFFFLSIVFVVVLECTNIYLQRCF